MDSLSIVIPAYNEEHRLPQTLRRVLDWLARGTFSFREVIVVDDGSHDSTARVVEEFARQNPCVRLARKPRQSGQGLLGAARHAGGEGQLDPVHRRGFVNAHRGTGETVPGNPRTGRGDRNWIASHRSKAWWKCISPPLRELSGRAFNLVMRMVTGLSFRDTQCGFKVVSRGRCSGQIFPLQKQDGFSFDVEDLLIAKKLGVQAVEVAVRVGQCGRNESRAEPGDDVFLDLVKIRRGPSEQLIRIESQ